MKKNILITGSTDGIGLATAKKLAALGHNILLHGRSATKVEETKELLGELAQGGEIEGCTADFSLMGDVEKMAKKILEQHDHLDVVINNAGVFRSPHDVTEDGLDVRFAVNTLAPYLLTQRLLPILNGESRIINLSSAAQSSVNLDALTGRIKMADDEMSAYAQSKLALTMWSRTMGLESAAHNGPSIFAVNPGSMLGSKMVQEGFGVPGGDINIGANILCRAALDDDFANVSGLYFDNDIGQFASPHADALNSAKSESVISTIRAVLKKLT